MRNVGGVFVALALGLSVPSMRAQVPEAREQRVRDYASAFNAREIGTMLDMVSDDIQWLRVAGATITVESQGKAALREGLATYFRSTPTVRSELEWVRVTSSRVAALERAVWQSPSGPKSQASLSVYEFSGDLISRVYYYPAEK